MKHLIKYVFFIKVILCNYAAFSQVNLVPNPSFEDTIVCPNGVAKLNSAKGWVNPTGGSPDYFNSCTMIGVGTPNNYFGYEVPRTGNAYAGFGSFAILPGVSDSAREYIQAPLFDTLIKGEVYCVEFYVSLADSLSEYAVNNIGAYFSVNAVAGSNYDPLPFLAQIVNTSANPLTNMNGWTKVSGQFTAQGGEQYITIGNFNANSKSDTVFIRLPSSTFSAKTSYYYIDDVSVIHLDGDANFNKGICNNLGVTLGRPAKSGLTYAWHPAVGLSDTTIAQPLATPTVTTTYYLTSTLTSSGCSKTDSVTVFYIPIGPTATINVSDSTLCPGEKGTATVTISSTASPYTYSWSNGVSGSGFQISGLQAGNYTVTVTDALGCTATSRVTFNNVSTPIALISATQTTITEGNSITLNGNGGVNYFWSPASSLTCNNCQSTIAAPIVTTTYTLIVTGTNGCTDTSDVTIKVNPLCLDDRTVFIPNVFSPNNDGKNDVLTIEGNGLTNIYWAIYDRWGNLVFETYDQIHGWDGSVKGNPVAVSIYSYYLRGTCVKTNGVVSLKGNVSLMR